MRESGARRAGVAPRRRRTPRGPSLEAGRAARGHGRPRHGRWTGDRGATVISGGGGGGQALAPPHPARPRATARRRRRPIGPPADPPMEPFPLMRCDPRFPSPRWRARGRRRGCHFAQPRRKDAYSTRGRVLSGGGRGRLPRPVCLLGVTRSRWSNSSTHAPCTALGNAAPPAARGRRRSKHLYAFPRTLPGRGGGGKSTSRGPFGSRAHKDNGRKEEPKKKNHSPRTVFL